MNASRGLCPHEKRFTTASSENRSIVTLVKSRPGAPGFGTIYLDVSLTHGHNLSVRSTVFVLHTANELGGFPLISKLQRSVALCKQVPPAHECIDHGGHQPTSLVVGAIAN
jgi:hypothetical protein